MKMKTVIILMNDPDDSIEQLIRTIEKVTKNKHSFAVMIDPESGSTFEKEIWIDGKNSTEILSLYIGNISDTT